MQLNNLFNLPKLMTMYEMQDSELMNSDKPQSKDSNEEKLAMMLKYEEVTPELIPFKM